MVSPRKRNKIMQLQKCNIFTRVGTPIASTKLKLVTSKCLITGGSREESEMQAKTIAVDHREVMVSRLSWLFAASGCVIACRFLFSFAHLLR
jgi:hypothetical protein